MRYFIDVDGVVRNLELYKKSRKFVSEEEAERVRTVWSKLPNELWRDMDRNPKEYLYDVPAYQNMITYIKCELGLENCVFLTNQCRIRPREEWTVKFIEKHFGKGNLIIFVGNFQEKINILKDNDSFKLFDDYPLFFEKDDFEEVRNRICLVEREWNKVHQHHYKQILKLDDEYLYVKCKDRIYNVEIATKKMKEED